MKVHSSWSDDSVERLKALYLAGRSGTEISRELGVTRNAVLGKLYRLGFLTKEISAKRAPRLLPQKRTSFRRVARPSAPKTIDSLVLKPLQLASASTSGLSCGILDVSGCRWAVSFDAAVIGRHIFCNAETEEGHSYCSHHEAVNIYTTSQHIIKRTVRWALSGEKRRAAL